MTDKYVWIEVNRIAELFTLRIRDRWAHFRICRYNSFEACHGLKWNSTRTSDGIENAYSISDQHKNGPSWMNWKLNELFVLTVWMIWVSLWGFWTVWCIWNTEKMCIIWWNLVSPSQSYEESKELCTRSDLFFGIWQNPIECAHFAALHSFIYIFPAEANIIDIKCMLLALAYKCPDLIVTSATTHCFFLVFFHSTFSSWKYYFYSLK